MAKKKHTWRERQRIGSTDIGSRPDANIIFYADSCDEDRGTPEIVITDSSEAKVKVFYNNLKKSDYDIKMYVALATWNKDNECWDIIDDEVIDSWQSEEQ